jgi:AraC family transcriptional regulator of adaptative response/methylated-DNA-[protein]-cysteine methyltransferase
MQNFDRIAKAIEYISVHFKEQPDLDRIAENVHLSPFHFQRMFTEWAGVSPKKFLQFMSIDYAKMLLAKDQTLLDVAYNTGLSGTGRLHDLFITIEGMTPGEYRNKGKNLWIRYRFAESLFGPLLVASTSKGICYLSFVENEKTAALKDLFATFENAYFIAEPDPWHQKALSVFKSNGQMPDHIKLHVKGTPFQIKVWEALLKIPMGDLTTYGNLAKRIEHTGASRAVGSAVGDNPVAFLIPCHRVIRQSGIIGQYRWGCPRKTAMIGWEAARTNEQQIAV